MQLFPLRTPIGDMVALLDEKGLHRLEFLDAYPKALPQNSGQPPASLISIQSELDRYFSGFLTDFETPIFCSGSLFQLKVWEELRKIPTGETRAYCEIAKTIGNPTASRAIGRANGTNRLAIVIPCHRVIRANGNLGGYAGGIERKQWLLNHEKRIRGLNSR